MVDKRRTFDETEVREMLRVACKVVGGQAAFAESLGVTRQLINKVLAGINPPSGRITRRLGLHKNPTTWSIDKGADDA